MNATRIQHDRLQLAVQSLQRQEYSTALSALNEIASSEPSSLHSKALSLRGFVHLKLLKFSQAEKDCSEAITQGMEYAHVLAWRAAARGEQSKWSQAFSDLDRASDLAGRHRDQYLGQMETYLASAGDYFHERSKASNADADLFCERGWINVVSGNDSKADRDFSLALNLEPRHAGSATGMATLKWQQQDFEQALSYCRTGLKGDQEHQRQTLHLRSQIYWAQGNAEALTRDLDRLSILSHGDTEQTIECCRLRMLCDDSITAIEELTELLESSPEILLAVRLRGDCFREIRNHTLAIDDYTQFLSVHHHDFRALQGRATCLTARNDWQAAHQDLDTILDSDDAQFEATLLRSKVFLGQKQTDNALTTCRRAIELNNEHAESFAVLASIYLDLCNYNLAIEEYSRSIGHADNHRDKANYLYQRGICHYEMEAFEQARDDLRKATRLNPNHAGSWIWRAAVMARLEKWSGAILGLQEAMKVNPGSIQQYHQLGHPIATQAIKVFDRQQEIGNQKTGLFRSRGLAHQFLGHASEAVADYSTAIGMESDDDTLIRRGQVLTDLEEYKWAINDFTEVIRRDRSNHWARYGRALARFANGDEHRAMRDLRKAIKTAPHLAHYRVKLADIYDSSGETEQALKALNRAVIYDHTNPQIYLRRGLVHYHAKQYEDAVTDFTHSLELHPQQEKVLVLRGQSYLIAGQPEKAIADFEAALTFNENLAEAYSGRADVLMQQRRFEYVLIWLTKAIHRFSGNQELAEIVFGRGQAFSRMGRYLPAISDFSVVMELVRNDSAQLSAARESRAIAKVGAEEFDSALRDFKKCLSQGWKQNQIQESISWLEDRAQPVPELLRSLVKVIRPTRPAVIRNGIELTQASIEKWTIEPPFDTWVIRSQDQKEYGPVRLGVLEKWICEGRIDIGMKLLRADWSKWQRAEKIFSDITPLERSGVLVDDFPELDL